MGDIGPRKGMRMKRAKGLLITCCSIGVVFSFGYPFHISLLRLHSSKDYVYSAVFWSLLLATLIVARAKWRNGRGQWWKPILGGAALGYVSSLLSYAVLVTAVGRVHTFREFSDILFVLFFPLVTFGWLIGAASAVCAHILDGLLLREAPDET